MAFPITLFDLPAKDGVAWSLNPWKTRMLLNFKGLPYTTEWVEYPDVEPRLKAIGLAPNEQSTPYTIPAIRLNASDGTLIYAMDSSRIASLIEKHYPSPPLYVSSAIHHRVQKLTEDAFPPLYGVFLPGVTRDLLNPRSKEYMDRTRGALLGMPLEQYEKEKGGEQAWANAEQPLKEIEQLLQAEDGPFFMGKTVSYADLVFVSFLHFASRCNRKAFDRLMSDYPTFETLYRECSKWLERGDH